MRPAASSSRAIPTPTSCAAWSPCFMRIFSGRTPAEILSVDPREVFDRLGLADALTPQRSNGLFSMMQRIRAEAARRSLTALLRELRKP